MRIDITMIMRSWSRLPIHFRADWPVIFVFCNVRGPVTKTVPADRESTKRP